MTPISQVIQAFNGARPRERTAEEVNADVIEAAHRRARIARFMQIHGEKRG